jgi:hypothetical protein
MAQPKQVTKTQTPAEQADDDAAYDAWFREQVAIGLSEADRGALVSDETVRAEWKRIRTELARRTKNGK